MESGIDISKLLMLFIPIVLLELGIRIFALVHMLKNENLRGNRIMWLFLILLLRLDRILHLRNRQEQRGCLNPP